MIDPLLAPFLVALMPIGIFVMLIGVQRPGKGGAWLMLLGMTISMIGLAFAK